MSNIKDKMERRKQELVRQYRKKLPDSPYYATLKLTDLQAFEEQDAATITRVLGNGRASHLLLQIGYPVDYQPADWGNGTRGER